MLAFGGMSLPPLTAQDHSYSVGGGVMRYRGDVAFSGSRLHPTFFAAYHRNLNPHFSWGVRGYWGRVSADDNADSLFQWRRWNFLSPVMGGEWELTFNFKKFVMDVRRVPRTLYVAWGVGVFYYAPTTVYGGRTYPLAHMPLESERSVRSGISVAIPMGVGFKQMLGERFFVQTAFRAYPTFTDYLDGLHGHFPQWANVSDSLVQRLSNTSVYSDAAVEEKLRGNPQNKDWFFTWTVSLHYVVPRSVCIVF